MSEQIAPEIDRELAQRLEGSLLVGSEFISDPGFRLWKVASPVDQSWSWESASALPEHGMAALDAAAEAQPLWQETASKTRCEIMDRYRDILAAHRELIADVIVRETGKTLSDALAEVDGTLVVADTQISLADRALDWQLEGFDPEAGSVRVVPVGPSLIITPWNFPLSLASRKIVSALLAGCTVIFKPSERTPLTGMMLVNFLISAGVPQGVVSALPTLESANLVEALTADLRLRNVSFTGSTAVGRQVLLSTTEHFQKAGLELGGNAPVIVLPDVDIARMTDMVWWGKVFNNGQSCVAPNRMFIPKSLKAKIRDSLLDQMSTTSAGDPWDPDVDLGPLINANAALRVRKWIAETSALEVHESGVTEPFESSIQPTLLFGVDPGSAICRRELFAPVLPVAFYDDSKLEDAVRWANSGEHGLAAYVFGEDESDAEQVAAKLDVGMVGVNRPTVSHPGLPFGGTKHSGYGVENGIEGIRSYVRLQAHVGP